MDLNTALRLADRHKETRLLRRGKSHHYRVHEALETLATYARAWRSAMSAVGQEVKLPDLEACREFAKRVNARLEDSKKEIDGAFTPRSGYPPGETPWKEADMYTGIALLAGACLGFFLGRLTA